MQAAALYKQQKYDDARKLLMELFNKLHELGNTLIVVTHESDIAERAGRIVRLSDGRIVSDEART